MKKSIIKLIIPLFFITGFLNRCKPTAFCNYADITTNCGLINNILQNLTSKFFGFNVIAGNTQNTVLWNYKPGVSYFLYWSNEPGKSTTSGNKINLDISPYIHTGLTNNTPYYYTLSILDNDIEFFSQEVTATPQFLRRNVFVTAINYAVTSLGSVSGADAICMSDSLRPSGPSTYKALLVDETGCAGLPCRRASVTADIGDGQIDWVLKPNTIYYRADGSGDIMATNANGLFIFGTLQRGWSSSPLTGISGLSSNWTTFSGLTCNNYSTGTGTVITAEYNQTSGGSISGAGLSCGNPYHLLCIEQ